MESKSTVSDMQSEAWQKYLNTDGWEPYEGQADLWNNVAAGSGPHLATMPPGYGKTRAAVGAYEIHRQLGRANRLLVFTPNLLLTQQWVEGARQTFALFGREIPALAVCHISEKLPVYIRASESGSSEIFIATYQQLLDDPGFWKRLLSREKWCVVADEGHHLSKEGKWSKALIELKSSVNLYVTATPIRHDRKQITGLNYRDRGEGVFEPIPTVSVSYLDAVHEEAAKIINVHPCYFFVDMEDREGNKKRVTSESLRQEGFENFNSFQAKKNMRLLDDYLSPILLEAVNALEAQLELHPDQHQMLVFAMNVSHAESVSRLLNKLTGDRNFSDWIGDGKDASRSQEEIDSIIKDYRDNKIKCLVNVDMVSEGFDNPRTSVLVFLHLVGSAMRTIQHIGRGIRRNRNIGLFSKDTCQIFASTDSPMLPIALGYQDEIDSLLDQKEVKERTTRDDASAHLSSIPDLYVLGVQLDRVDNVSIGSESPPSDLNLMGKGAAWLRSIGTSQSAIDAMPDEALVNIGRQQKTNVPPRKKEEGQLFETMNSSRELELKEVNRAAGILARNVAILRMRHEKSELPMSIVGDTIHAIHREYKRIEGSGHDEMSPEELRKKYVWIQRINETLEIDGVPRWLRV